MPARFAGLLAWPGEGPACGLAYQKFHLLPLSLLLLLPDPELEDVPLLLLSLPLLPLELLGGAALR